MTAAMKFPPEFLAILPDFSAVLPVTAVIAILIFVIREILEKKRRDASDARKVLALKKVLARECQLNYTAIIRLRDTLTEMQESGVSENASRLSISEHPTGRYSVMVTDAHGSGSGGALLGIQKDSLLKHLIEIAGLSESLYSKCELALDGLSEAEHVYQMLVHGPNEYFPSTPENYYDGVIYYGLGELDDSIASLRELYLVCTGSVLKQGKLR